MARPGSCIRSLTSTAATARGCPAAAIGPLAGQRLNHPQAEGGGANASAGDGQPDQPMLRGGLRLGLLRRRQEPQQPAPTLEHLHLVGEDIPRHLVGDLLLLGGIDSRGLGHVGAQGFDGWRHSALRQELHGAGLRGSAMPRLLTGRALGNLLPGICFHCLWPCARGTVRPLPGGRGPPDTSSGRWRSAWVSVYDLTRTVPRRGNDTPRQE
jgi:hypothetical protein